MSGEPVDIRQLPVAPVKTGPRPWPPGTEFVYVVRRYRSGVFRVQRTPRAEAEKRTRPNHLYVDISAAGAEALSLAQNEVAWADDAVHRAQSYLVKARRAKTLTRDAISTSRHALGVIYTPYPQLYAEGPSPLAITDAEAEASGPEP